MQIFKHKYLYPVKIFLLITTIFVSEAFPLDPQKKFSQYVFNNWQTQEGLPQNTISSIIQTKDGYLWFGTQEGLVRFDGERFTIFDTQNTPAIKYNNVSALYEDISGNLWIGTLGGGLSCYKNKEFKDYSISEGLNSNTIKKIVGDKNGNIWIISNQGIIKYHDGVFSPLKIKEDNLEATSFLEDGKGDYWIGTTDGIVYRFHKDKLIPYGISNESIKSTISDLYEDSNGTIWVSTSKGLFTIKNYEIQKSSLLQFFNKLQINSVYEDREHVIWVSASNGLARIENGKIDWCSSKDGLSDDQIYCTLEDNEGSLWIGTGRGGINRIKDGVCYAITKKDGLTSNEAFSVYQDSDDNDIWVGTSNGLNLISNGKIKNFLTQNGLPGNFVLPVYKDKSGSVWVGTNGSGLAQIVGNKIRNYSTKDGLPGNRIYSICKNDDNSFWIGTNGNGISLYKNGKFTNYGEKDGLSSRFVDAVIKGKENTLWIGTQDGGLNLFKDGKFTSFTTKNGLSNNIVFSVYVDYDGTLWIGTGGGLNRFKNGKFTVYTTKDGLFDNTAFQILDDGLGYLWMSCNKGIYKVSKKELDDYANKKIKTLNCISYGVEDGMKIAECNGGDQPSAIKDHNGNLWFPTMKGVVVIDPRKLKSSRKIIPVYIEKISINNTQVNQSAQNVFPVEDGKLEFDYTAISFLVPKKIKFKYKLEGFDKGWIDASNRRVAYYTNIPYGNYTFKVIACNDEGVWNTKGASFSFYLKPTFYQTFWFYAASIFVILSLIYFGYRYWLNILLKQKEALEAKIAERTASLLNEKNKLEEAEKKFRSVTESANDAIVGLNSEGKIFLWNRSAEVLFGYSMLEALGKEFGLLFHDPMISNKKNALSQFLISNSGKTIELTGKSKSSQIYPLEVSFSDWKSGTEVFYTAIIRDITERKQSEQALKESEAKLKELNLKKDKFFSVMSHDLRSPFSSVLGFSEYLTSEADKLTLGEIKNFSANIHRSASGIMRLLENLLLWARFQTNVIEFVPEVFSLNNLINEILEIYHANFIQKNQNIELYLDENLKVVADRNMIDSVIRNLVSNAIKFTNEKGTIKITATRNSKNIEVIIEDDGLGIKEEYINKLFKIEENYSTEGTQKEKGTGLGLILCKEFIMKNNGDIWVESRWGKGSKFHFTLQAE